VTLLLSHHHQHLTPASRGGARNPSSSPEPQESETKANAAKRNIDILEIFLKLLVFFISLLPK
jgi:hypothetical protein